MAKVTSVRRGWSADFCPLLGPREVSVTSPHRLSEVNTEEHRAICSVCGPTRIINRGKNKPPCCRNLLAYRQRLKRVAGRPSHHRRGYILKRKDCCERCGFQPEIPGILCQLDVDHKNGDHSDNSEENLQTLCANCHRLKTWLDAHDRGDEFWVDGEMSSEEVDCIG